MDGKPRPTSAATTPTRRSMKQQTLTSLNMNAPVTPPRNAASPGSGGALAAEESKRTTRAAAQLTPTRTPTNDASVSSNGAAVATTASPSRARTRVVVTPMVATPRTPLLRPRRSTSAHSVGLRDPYEQHTLEALKEECARRGLSMQPRDHPQSNKPVRFTKTQYVELLQEADMLAMFERQSSSRRGSGSASSNSNSTASGSRKRASRKVEMTPPAPVRVVAVAARPAATATVASTASTASIAAPAAAVKAAAKPANAAKPKRVYAPRKKAATASLAVASSQTKPSESTVTIASPPAIVRSSMTAAAEPSASTELEEKRPVLVVAAKPKPTETVDLTEDETIATTTTTTTDAASPSQPSPAKPPQTTLPVSEKPPVVAMAVAEKKAAAPTTQTPASVSPAKPLTPASAPAPAPATAKPLPTTTPVAVAAAAKPATTTTAAVRGKKKPSASTPAAAAATASASPEAPVGTASTFRSAIRARRGCRFRLINVLMSPDFNTRWREMHVVPPERGDVNVFWRDVHISFLCQNSFYDKLHFVDPLFDNVAPEMIQNHTAQKLQQMWSEIVTMYRRTWNQAKRSAEPKPFLDSCAGRLDLLYLHMGLLLEPELHKAIVNDAVPPRPRPPFVIVSNEAATVTMVGPAPTKAPLNTSDDSTPAKKPEAARKAAASARSTEMTMDAEDLQLGTSSSSAYGQPPRFVELKNPDMLPSWLLEDQAKTAVERGLVSSAPATSSSSAASPAASAAAASSTAKAKKPRASRAKKPTGNAAASPGSASKATSPSPVKTRDLVLHSSAINSIDDDSASSDYETTDNNTPAQSTQRRAAGKRRRGSSAAASAAGDAATTTDLVEVPTSRELVPHPHKRLHTTAVTTTLTRSSVAPDEFDVMHHRLRKVNESIDQCYRTLGNSEAILNDMHREDVEADLRFYFGIKKRIQEQIVMFMHGF